MGAPPGGAFVAPLPARSRGLLGRDRRLPRACAAHPAAADGASGETVRWMRSIVVRLGLCPFAGPAADSGGVRVRSFSASDERGAEAAARGEMDYLLANDEVATTLVVLPAFAADDFLRWHAFTTALQRAVERDARLADHVMLACFHPLHTWAGLHARDALHYDRRAPHPTVNVLRVAHVDAAATAGATDGILARNERTLREVGYDEMRRLYTALEM